MKQRTIDRRRIVGALAAPLLLPVAATQAVTAQTPAASPIPRAGSQIDLYAAARAALLDQGRAVTDLVLAADDAAVLEVSSPEIADALGQTPLEPLLASLQTDRVRMEWTAGGAHFDGRYDGSQLMTGFFWDVAAGQFQLEAETGQGGEVPAGRWNGVITPANLEISVTFSGTASDLSATFDAPALEIQAEPLDNVAFIPNQPIGERVEERALLFNPAARTYTAAYAWGDAQLVLDIGFDANDQIVGFLYSALWPLPEDPMAGFVGDAAYRLPVDGELLVFWGGETVLQNYHAAYPSQRHALDLVVWRDGATFGGVGTANADYFIWGRLVVAPAAGQVVAVLNDQPDIEPGQIAAGAAEGEAADVHPAGNHVVIEVADGEFLLIAHLQHSSVTVAVGDAVAPGDPVGLVGNSGNTSEPHVHIHAQSVADFFDPAAVGVPITFQGYLVDGEAVDGGRPIQGQFIEQR